MNTYGKLLNSDLTGQLNNKLETVTKTDGHLCLYIGMKGSPKDLGLSTTNLWIYPSYDHDKNVNQYLEDRNRPFPVLYLSFPSTKDPEKLDSSPNRTTMEAITLAPFSWFEKWKDQPWKNRGEDYESMKEQFCQRMFDQIFLTLPQLKNKIDYYELSTPLSTKSMMNYDGGELYGLEHTPSRFRQRWLRPQTPVQGLFLTGQDITTVGLTGALFSGLLTCSSILKKNLYKEII
jgi:all-trans-retinol 13,14-reductase